MPEEDVFDETPQEPFPKMSITPETVSEILGPEPFESEGVLKELVPGIATGMAWTQVGGEILFVEATRVAGRGNVKMTGKLGDVMKESVSLATTWIRANRTTIDELVGIPLFAEKDENGEVSATSTHLPTGSDVHIHFPAGAVPKDGPSAGVTITTALISVLTGRCVRCDVSMTGEISLRGLVLPVGGIKEKVLAAHRGGIKHVLIPKRNEKDLADLPESVKNDVKFTLCSKIEDVLKNAFVAEDASSKKSKAGSNYAPPPSSQVPPYAANPQEMSSPIRSIMGLRLGLQQNPHELSGPILDCKL